ncbi:MAG: glycosyltransferase family 39 protein [Oscillospiraceae bacterium]|nr:glycosyltransferase family 39 protein [Oscillospiraceae bacterium]
MSCTGLARLCRWLLRWGAGLCVGALGLLNVLVLSEVAYDGSERVDLQLYILPGLFMLLGLAILFLGLGRIRRLLERIDEGKLFWLLAALSAIAAGYLICNVDSTLRFDARAVFMAARELSEGNFSSLQREGYLYHYPHQLGVVAYLQLLSCISRQEGFVFLVNFLMVLWIDHSWWKISRELFDDKLVSVFTLLFSFAFLPQLFFILFAYGLIPGFCFLSLGFYHAIRYGKTGRWRHGLAAAVFAGVAALLKQNYLIGAIAILIWLFLLLLRDKKPRTLAVMLLLILSMKLPGALLQSAYERAGGVSLEGGAPSILWIAMGTDISNQKRAPGWYNDRRGPWSVFIEADYDGERAAEIGRVWLTENWEKIKARPRDTLVFFAKKLLSQWCDPLYQSVWTGPLESTGQYTHTPLLRSLYSGGLAEDIAEHFSKFLNLAIWLLAALFLLRHGFAHEGWEPMAIYLIGGLLFHFIWEGKSQYTYTYVFSLIPLAAYAAAAVTRKYGKKGG